MAEILNRLGSLAGATRFRRISENLYSSGDKIYQDAGINFKASWFPVYYALANASTPQTIMEIADSIGFSHITVKNVLKELTANSLVDIQVNPRDKRSKIVTLSFEGQDLLLKLKPLWLSFTHALESTFTYGHPDLINILNRVDKATSFKPIDVRVKEGVKEEITMVDYRPSLKQSFFDLAEPWLRDVLDGDLEEEDVFTLNHPDQAYVMQGGFLFFAMYKGKAVGCVVLKRLDEESFEFAKLFIEPYHRSKGIATQLIERCITRCKENQAKELWLQTTMSMPEAHKLYYKLGFDDAPAPDSMDVLNRTEKIMMKAL